MNLLTFHFIRPAYILEIEYRLVLIFHISHPYFIYSILLLSKHINSITISYEHETRDLSVAFPGILRKTKTHKTTHQTNNGIVSISGIAAIIKTRPSYQSYTSASFKWRDTAMEKKKHPFSHRTSRSHYKYKFQPISRK